MCESAEDGGQRCAAHTRRGFATVAEGLRAESKPNRGKVRLGKGEREHNQAVTNMMLVAAHASTPTGKREVQSLIAEMERDRDIKSVAWLRTCIRSGDTQAAAAKETKKLIRAAQTKQRRAESRSSSAFAPSRNATEGWNLAAVYPQIAAQWDRENNEGVQADQVTPYANVMAWWVCERGHRWQARVNNRGNRARDGVATRCPECSGRRQRTLEDMQASLAEVAAAVEDPEAWESLSAATRHSILARAGLLDEHGEEFQRAAALSMVHGDLSLREVLAARNVNQIEELVDDGLGEDRELDLSEGVIKAATQATGQPEENRDTRLARIVASAGAAGAVGDDEALAEAVLHEGVEALWNEVHNDPDDVDVIVARVSELGAGGNPYRQALAERFTSELTRVQETPLPDGYNNQRVSESGLALERNPNLSQRRFALLVNDRRKVMNFSGTGAGKTLSGVLAVKTVDAQETLVLCPAGQITKQWANEFTAAFPGEVEIREGLPPVGEDLTSSWTRPRVWVVNYDKLSHDSDQAAERLSGLAPRLDAAVLDEVHMVKDSDDGTPSQRRIVLEGFLDNARANNPDLAVVAASATPVITNLAEAKSLVRLTTGEDPENFDTAPTIANAANAYRVLSAAGPRWKPAYKSGIRVQESEVDITANVGRVMARIERSAARNPSAASHPATMERALLPEKLPKIVSGVKTIGGPTIVYSEYTVGIVDPIVDALRSEGITADRYTGEESTAERESLLRRFQEGKVQVIVGSKPIATGVDGFQRVCSNMIVAVPPWTDAAKEQLFGRLYRTGQTQQVNVTHIKTFAEVGEGTRWSFCQGRLNRLKFRGDLASAAVDGRMPEGHLTNAADDTRRAVDSLRKLVASLGRANETAAA